MAADTASDTPQLKDAESGKAFGHTFWMLNSIEAFERLAYFGIRAVVPIYIMQATEPGGLHMTAVHKGVIYAWWAVFQSILPMFTGGFADRYGYKKVLGYAITANVVGYLMMAFLHSYVGFFAGILVLATGTAFFKPALQGSIAQNLNKENSSMGWGVFYWVVNVGAVLAPLLATAILGTPHSAEGWRNLFIASALYTAINLLLLLTFKDVPSGSDKSTSMVKVFSLTVENIWPYWFVGGTWDSSRGIPGLALTVLGFVAMIWQPFGVNATAEFVVGGVALLIGLWLTTWLRGGKFQWQLRLPAFLLIMSCFWMMMYQVWDLHPNFIEDWVDSSNVAQYAPEMWKEYGDRGLVRVPQQILLTLNAFLIVLLVVPISWLVRKMRALQAMLIGMALAAFGTVVAGWTGNAWILLLGIVFFSLGEMLTGPKKNQYLGLIAPPGKKGLYLGYVNIPVGFGVFVGSLLAGHVYDSFGEKATLALKELASSPELTARAVKAADWSDSLHLVPDLLGIKREEAFSVACTELGQDEETAAQTLRDYYRYDRGQIENICLQYLISHPEFKEKAMENLAKALEEKKAGKFDASRTADYVDLMPEAIGRKRIVAFEIATARLAEELQLPPTEGQEQVVDELWKRYGDDKSVLNNLALEYLAQASSRLSEAVASLDYEHPIEHRSKRIDELKKRLGIDRLKSFSILAAAMGAGDADTESALSSVQIASDEPLDRAYAYLLTRHDHHRFLAVARKDWSKDIGFLHELVSTDEEVRAVVLAGIDKVGFQARLAGGLRKILSGGGGEEVVIDGVNYSKLAYNPDLIQKALKVKDWASVPQQGARLLRMNPFEAKSLVAAGVSNSPVLATQQLWDKYDPQLKVWLPFAGIGVLAAIALAIFGQMAKRWADMNA